MRKANYTIKINNKCLLLFIFIIYFEKLMNTTRFIIDIMTIIF